MHSTLEYDVIVNGLQKWSKIYNMHTLLSGSLIRFRNGFPKLSRGPSHESLYRYSSQSITLSLVFPLPSKYQFANVSLADWPSTVRESSKDWQWRMHESKNNSHAHIFTSLKVLGLLHSEIPMKTNKQKRTLKSIHM